MTSETKSGFGTGAIILAFVGGALAGTAVALLLAPGSGAETRARIGGAVTGAGDQVRRARLAAAAAAGAAKEAFAEGMVDGH